MLAAMQGEMQNGRHTDFCRDTTLQTAKQRVYQCHRPGRRYRAAHVAALLPLCKETPPQGPPTIRVNTNRPKRSGQDFAQPICANATGTNRGRLAFALAVQAALGQFQTSLIAARWHCLWIKQAALGQFQTSLIAARWHCFCNGDGAWLHFVKPKLLANIQVNKSMASKDYLEKVTIGEVEKPHGKIVLQEYDARWQDMFDREKAKIDRALAGTRHTVEHVGSTSVAGLCAKPIIDILLTVEDSGNESMYVGALEAEGYRLRVREPEWHAHRMLKGKGPEVNLHVFSEGCAEAKRMLDFRDRLRTDDADRQLYAATKRALAEKNWECIQDYADAKSAVVAEILSHTER